jgi:hypothetical protein
MLDESWLVIGEVRWLRLSSRCCRRRGRRCRRQYLARYRFRPLDSKLSVDTTVECKNEQGKVREEGNWVESLLGGRTGFLGGSTNRAELGRDVALERGSSRSESPGGDKERINREAQA